MSFTEVGLAQFPRPLHLGDREFWVAHYVICRTEGVPNRRLRQRLILEEIANRRLSGIDCLSDCCVYPQTALLARRPGGGEYLVLEKGQDRAGLSCRLFRRRLGLLRLLRAGFGQLPLLGFR